MSLKEKLMDDLKLSMKNKNKLRKDTIIMIRSAIKQKEVDERMDLVDEDIISIISKQLKEKENSIIEFQKGNRDDLVDQANNEIKILLEYLPQQLTEEELRKIIQETIKELSIDSPKQMGILMKNLMPKIKGKANGNMVSKISKELLEN